MAYPIAAQTSPNTAPKRTVEATSCIGLLPASNRAKISPTKSPSQIPDKAPPSSTRLHVSRPVTRSSWRSSVPTMRQFCTGKSLSESVSTARWASAYLSKTPIDIG